MKRIDPQTSKGPADRFTGDVHPTIVLAGASPESPVNVSVSSACVSQGKATLSPSKFSATGSTVTLQYRDNGCGAVQSKDQLQAVVDGTAATAAYGSRIGAAAGYAEVRRRLATWAAVRRGS